MAPPPQIRVLRCCSCRLFQAHQVKKSRKWTCKACGEKQSFLRTYGEGSGADCRRHVQKLNLLQGQVSEMSLRSLEEPVNADEEENAGPGRAEHMCLQDHSGLAELVGEGSCCEDWDTREFTGPWGGPPCPAQWFRATSSKWDRFLLTPGKSSHVDTEPLTSLQRGPRPGGRAQAEQTPGVLQLSQATHTPMAEPKRPFAETSKHMLGTGPQAESGPLVKRAQEPGPMRLGDLFNTGEDFDDDL